MYLFWNAGTRFDAVPRNLREVILKDIAVVAKSILVHDSLCVGSTSEVFRASPIYRCNVTSALTRLGCLCVGFRTG